MEFLSSVTRARGGDCIKNFIPRFLIGHIWPASDYSSSQIHILDGQNERIRHRVWPLPCE